MAQLLLKDGVAVHHMRTHIKAVLGDIVTEILLLAGSILTTVYMPPEWEFFNFVLVWVITLIVALPLFFVPVLCQASSTYMLTSERITTCHGIFNRHGHDLPLSRILDTTSERDLTNRLFGCGTLTLQTFSDDPLVPHDILKINHVQLEVSNLLFDDVQGAADTDPKQVE